LIRPTRTALFIALGCISTSFAWAQEAKATQRRIDIPAGDLVTGLDALAAQSGTQLLYRADQLKGVRTRGVHGNVSPDEALKKLLSGSGYDIHRDASSGAVVIVKADPQEPAAKPAPPPPPPRPAPAQAEAPQQPAQLESVEVTGSRIPRAEVEGPAPVTVITAQQISSAGFTSVPDVLRSLTQNSGETQLHAPLAIGPWPSPRCTGATSSLRSRISSWLSRIMIGLTTDLPCSCCCRISGSRPLILSP